MTIEVTSEVKNEVKYEVKNEVKNEVKSEVKSEAGWNCEYLEYTIMCLDAKKGNFDAHTEIPILK